MLVSVARKWIWGAALAGICLFGGCSLDRQLAIDPGYYRRVEDSEEGSLKAPPFIEAVEVQRDREQVVFHLRKGGPLTIAFSAREKDQWPTGCPGNIYSQRMEVFDLHAGPEAAGILPFENPVLIRNCPQTPYQLVLRADGKMGGGSAACPYPEECHVFVPGSDEKAGEDCPELAQEREEMEQVVRELEGWNAQLVEGYGPGVWYFSGSRYPLFHHRPDRATLEGISASLNEMLAGDGLPGFEVVNIRDREVEIAIDDSRQLTQGMGSTGAQSYLNVVTYSLTSVPEVDCVNYRFVPGDHAQPGVRCR